MKPVNEILNKTIKNGQGGDLQIIVDALSTVDIYQTHANNAHELLATVRMSDIQLLVEEFEDKIIGKCEVCSHCILANESYGDDYWTDSEGCHFHQNCYGWVENNQGNDSEKDG